MVSGQRDCSFRVLFRLTPIQSIGETALPNHSSRVPPLKIGLDYSRRGVTTLATIGRDANCDIVINNPFISRLQCSFEINPANGLISLVDKSRNHTTEVGGKNSVGFPPIGQREVVVLPDFNDQLYLGNKHDFKFQLNWGLDAASVIKHTKAFVNDFQPVHPQRALTMEIDEEYRTNKIGADDALTAVQSRAISRLCTPGAEPQAMTWKVIEPIGDSKSGSVYRAANGFSGGLIAVKRMDARAIGGSRNSLLQIERTVESLRNISHDHIVGIIRSSGWRDNEMQIAMELKDGNLQSLADLWRARQIGSAEIDHLGLKAMQHSLLGLKWLHENKFIHGSVAPHNILYTQKGDNFYSIHSFHFVLADFGLSTSDPKNEYNQAFHAPERHYPDRRVGRKSDIWSLYVTLLMVLQVDDFAFNIRTYDMDHHFDVVVQTARSTMGSLKNLHVMARQNPEERWSANEVLEHFFRLGYFLNRPLPPPDQLPHERRQYCPSSYKAPRGNLTRQSTMEKLKQTSDNIIRRITGDISDAVGRRGMTFRGHD
ncbi:unnamed protein product [Clonostachys rosea]|uniref:Protein kinase domain-containing protein n=1 Tax=Bionectria ochroleuca TaxID=29856 RepID=A0ABY6ULP7_BIOOC|nr:unnamed protein product [Clonostachys rosea]